MAYDYYPGFTMYDRPDYKYLTRKGCSPTDAFRILERNSDPVGKCGNIFKSRNDLYKDPLFIISQQQTTTIFQKNPALLSPKSTPPIIPITQPIIPITHPIIPITQPPPPSPFPLAPITDLYNGGSLPVQTIVPDAQPFTQPYRQIINVPSAVGPRRRLTRTEIEPEHSGPFSTHLAQETAIRRDKVIEAKHGFEGYVNKPTYFLAGESGREHVKITPSRNVRKKKGLYDFDLRGKWGGRSDIFIKDTGGF